MMAEDETKFYAPDAAFIEALARSFIATLPEDLRAQTGRLGLRVLDFVTEDQLDQMGLDDPYDLTSLSQTAPEVIWLFRRPILDEWAERGDICLGDLVIQTLLLELATLFGWTDPEIAAHPALAATLREGQRHLAEWED